MNMCKYNKFVGCNVKEGCNTCEVYVVYQQGREDAFKEIAYSDDVKKEEFEILAYNKGRADAIREYEFEEIRHDRLLCNIMTGWIFPVIEEEQMKGEA